MSTQRVQAGCLCGALRCEMALPSLWCAHCHCEQCRRFHGAGVVTWVGFDAAQFRVLSGERKLRWYASSAAAQRGFCGECGSGLLFRSQRWPGEMHVTLANILDPIDRQPEAHAYFAEHVPWLALDDTLPHLFD